MLIKITNRGVKHNFIISIIVIRYCLTIPKRIFGVIFHVSIMREEICIILKVFDGRIHVTDGAHDEGVGSGVLIALVGSVTVGRTLLSVMLEFVVAGPRFKLVTRFTNE